MKSVTGAPVSEARTWIETKKSLASTTAPQLKNTNTMPSDSAIERASTVLPQPWGPSSRMLRPDCSRTCSFLLTTGSSQMPSIRNGARSTNSTVIRPRSWRSAFSTSRMRTMQGTPGDDALVVREHDLGRAAAVEVRRAQLERAALGGVRPERRFERAARRQALRRSTSWRLAHSTRAREVADHPAELRDRNIELADRRVRRGAGSIPPRACAARSGRTRSLRRFVSSVTRSLSDCDRALGRQAVRDHDEDLRALRDGERDVACVEEGGRVVVAAVGLERDDVAVARCRRRRRSPSR